MIILFQLSPHVKRIIRWLSRSVETSLRFIWHQLRYTRLRFGGYCAVILVAYKISCIRMHFCFRKRMNFVIKLVVCAADPLKVESIQLPAMFIHYYKSNNLPPNWNHAYHVNMLSGTCFKRGELETRKDYFWIQLCLVFNKTKQGTHFCRLSS